METEISLTQEQLLQQVQELKNQLEKKTRQFKSVLACSALNFWEWDPQTTHISVSPQSKTLAGHDLQNSLLDFTLWKDWLHPDDQPRVLRHISNILELKPEHFELEYRIKTPAGDWRWILNRGYIISEPDGHFLFQGTTFDITAYKSTQAALEWEQWISQNLLDVANVMILVINADQRVAMINRKGCEILGGKEIEIVGKNWFDHFIPAEQREAVKSVFDKLMKSDFPKLSQYTNEIITLDGQRRCILWDNTFLRDSQDRIFSTLSSGMDITERTQLQQALETSEVCYQTLFNQVPSCIMMYDPVGRLLKMNPAGLNLFGLPLSGQIPAQNLFEQPAFPAQYHERLQQGYIVDFEIRLDREEFKRQCPWASLPEEHINLQGQAIPLLYDQTLIKGYVLRLQNITEQKEYESALCESETRYRTVFESAGDLVLVHDNQGRFLDFNQTACTTLEYSRPELFALPLPCLASAEHQPQLLKWLEQDFSQNHSVFITECQTKSGRQISFEICAQGFEYQGQAAILSIARNITERARAEQEMRAWYERFIKAFKFNPVPMMLSFANDARIIDVNRSLLTLFEGEEQDMLGRSLMDLGLCSGAEFERLRTEIKQQGCVRNFFIELTGFQGKHFRGLLFSEPIQLGQQQCLLTAFLDLTLAHTVMSDLQEASQRIGNILEIIPLLLISVDDQNRVTHWNATAARLFNIQPTEALGRVFTEINIPWTWNKALENLPFIRRWDRPLQFRTLAYRRTDGSEGLLTLSVNPLTLRNRLFAEFLIVGQDITLPNP